MKVIYITTISLSIIAGLYLLFKTFKVTEYYEVDPKSITKVKTQTICTEINNSRFKVPKNAQKAPVPRNQLHRRQYTYPYDANDSFYYDVVFAENPTKIPLVLVCFMMGHSKSACIRRMTDAFVKQGHNVYILLPRGALDTIINPKQKKFRSEGYDVEDLDVLIGLIPDKRVILAGYSLGGFTACHFMTNEGVKNQNKVEKLVLTFVEHDPNHTLKLPPRIKRFLGSGLATYINKNEQYFIEHGFSKQILKEILKVGTVEHYDLAVWCKIKGIQTVKEYYDGIALHDRMLKLKIPTLFLNTRDDIIAGNYIPLDRMRLNENIEAVVFNKGNHLGTVLKDGQDLVSYTALRWTSE